MTSEEFRRIPAEDDAFGADGCAYLVESSIDNAYSWKLHWGPPIRQELMKVVDKILSMTMKLSTEPGTQTAGAKQSYPPGYFAQQIEKLESANITNDVAAAVQKSDFRFLVCVGFGGIVPGVPHWNEELYRKYGSRVIDGTGDMIISEEQNKFKKTAAAYAEMYNKLLWLKTEGKK